MRLRTRARVRPEGSAPADAPTGVPVGACANGAAEALPEPAQKPPLCENCERREPVRLVASPTEVGKAGLPLAVWVCRACAPKRPRKKTKHRRATTDFFEKAEEILYRQAGATPDQVARWLLLTTDDFDGRPDPHKSALEAAYRALSAMGKSGVAEVISIRRRWMGKKAGVSGAGRREDFYRFREGADGAVEGALLAGVDGAAAKRNYARPWFGGGIEHASHRGDVMLLFAEQAADWEVDIDPFSVYGETHPGFPLVGYELPRVDAAGVKKPPRENASHTYERVVPDGAFVAVFGDAGETQDEGSGWGHDREHPQDFGGGTGGGEGSCDRSETGEEVYA